jgi:HEPN domain-containing protein
METIHYYAPTPVSGGNVRAIFRYFSDESKLPEKYVLGAGWIEDQRLLGYLMMGELGPPDVVTEEKAQEIIKQLHLIPKA